MTGSKRIGAPFIQRPRGHHIGMAGKAKHRTAAAALRPKIIHRAEAQAFDVESDGLQPLDHQRLAAAVGRTDRLARDQILRQLQGVIARHQKRSTGGLTPQVDPQTPDAQDQRR